MSQTEQMPGLSVLEHGESVHRYFLDLKAHVLEGAGLGFDWKLPEWIYNERLWDSLAPAESLKNYQVFHDCGKPFCLEIDDEGRRHFPNHAEVSADIWLQLTGNELESELMRHDMDIHLLKAAGFDAFKNLDIAPSLILTGLAEIHSNAVMFGGIDSTSFKIKWKSLNKFGGRYVRQVLEGVA